MSPAWTSCSGPRGVHILSNMNDTVEPARHSSTKSDARRSTIPLKTTEFRCEFCPGHSFRRSRLRLQDISALLLLRYPVRCLRCSQRQLVSFSLAGISVPAHIKHQRLPTDAESWRSWTAREEGKPSQPNSPSATAPSYRLVDTAPKTESKPAANRELDHTDDIW